MITISVEHKPLFIPADTAIILEQNNNLLGEDGICADIVWSFEVPAEPNQRILGSVQYTCSSGNRRYECEIAVDGIPVSLGELYVQSTKDENRLTCGIVANSFGKGFGEKKMNKNDYGEDVVISNAETTHQSAWRTFLRDSITSNIYRFFLFYDSKFYKDNDDYGYYLDRKSPLVENTSENLANGYVNRLFFTTSFSLSPTDGHATETVSALIEDGDTSRRGCRIFNARKIRGKQNGYGFAPALRLDWLVRKVVENATLSPFGTFFDAPEIQKLYSQSFCAMDGNATQYGSENMLLLSNINNVGNNGDGQGFMYDQMNDVIQKSFHNNKPVNLCADYSLLLDRSQLNTETYDTYDRYDEDHNPVYTYHEKRDVYAIMVCKRSGYTFPRYRMKVEVPNGGEPFIYGEMKSKTQLTTEAEQGLLIHDLHFQSPEYAKNGWMKILFWRGVGDVYYNTDFIRQVTPLIPADCYFLQITPSRSYPMENEATGQYVRGEKRVPTTFTSSIEQSGNTYRPLYDVNEEMCLRLVKFKVHSYKGHDLTVTPVSGTSYKVESQEYGYLEELTDFSIISNTEVGIFDPALNIFSNLLEWRKHVPNLSNGEFLNTICKTFGLSLYTNTMTRQLQLNFFTDTLQGAPINISQWVSCKERLEYSPKQYNVSFSPLLGKSNISEGNTLDAIRSRTELPSALMNIGKHIFIEKEAAFRGSEINEDKATFTWPQEAGDSRPLIAGATTSEGKEDVTIDVGIPNMTDPDEFSGVDVDQKYICQVEQEGCSPMLDKEYNGEFPMVLMQEKGWGYLPGGARYVEANPTEYGTRSIDSSNLSTSTVGDNSIGERWLRPVYDLLGNCDRYRLVAHLPSWAFFKVMATMQPQAGTPSQQVRYIQCEGLRIIPVKISYELSGRASIVCTIEGVCPHHNLE